MEPECPHKHIIELLRAVLPHILDITRFFFLGKDSRASDAKQWAKMQHGVRGGKKPFHVTLYADLKLLFDVVSTFTESQNQVQSNVLKPVRMFLGGLEEDFINSPLSEKTAHSSVSRNSAQGPEKMLTFPAD